MKTYGMTNASTYLVLLVDHSSSMARIRKAMEASFRDLVAEQSAVPGSLRVAMREFNTTCKTLYRNTSIKNVPGMKIKPQGMTALYDALGTTLVETNDFVHALPPKNRPHNIVIAVITDGEENASRKFSAKQLRNMIKEYRSRGWSFTYISSAKTALKSATRLGIGADHVLRWAPTVLGVQAKDKALSGGLKRVRSGAKFSYNKKERADALR